MIRDIESSFALLAMIKNGRSIGLILLVIAVILSIAFISKRVSKSKNKVESKKSNNKEVIDDIEVKKENDEILRKENILLGLEKVEKEDAIKMLGRLLVNSGYTGEEYIQAMLDREKVVSTYIGNGVAIPHGVGSSKDKIKQSGIVVLQFPQGIDFGEGNIAYLVIGIAGKDNDHLRILSNIATSLEDEKVVEKLVNTKNVNDIYEIFTSN